MLTDLVRKRDTDSLLSEVTTVDVHNIIGYPTHFIAGNTRRWIAILA